MNCKINKQWQRKQKYKIQINLFLWQERKINGNEIHDNKQWERIFCVKSNTFE